MTTPREVLGVGHDATPGEIRRAYRLLAKRWHPDVCQEPGAAQRFQEITEAYRSLTENHGQHAGNMTLDDLHSFIQEEKERLRREDPERFAKREEAARRRSAGPGRRAWLRKMINRIFRREG